jgi:hypothetical protein
MDPLVPRQESSGRHYPWSNPRGGGSQSIGFMHRALNYGTVTSGLIWSASTVRWAILGTLIGACIVYVRQLLQMSA